MRYHSLHADVQGDGDLNVLFLPGYLEDARMWRVFDGKFPGCRQHRLELPGQGKSPVSESFSGMEGWSKEINRYLESNQISQVCLIGHSMGGYAALNFARHFAEKVAGICLYHSTAREDEPFRKIDRDRAVLAVKTHKRQYINTAIAGLFAEPEKAPWKKKVRELQDAAMESSIAGIQEQLRAMRDRRDEVGALREYDFPVWYVLGEHDMRLPKVEMEAEVAQNKQCKVIWLGDCGHMSYIESPDSATKALEDFIRQCADSDRA